MIDPNKYFKNSFLVFRSVRKSKHSKILEFNLFKSRLYHARPIYKGKIEFYNLDDEHLRPFRAWFEYGNKELYIDPKKIISALRSVKQVFLDENDVFPFKDELIRFFEEQKIKYETTKFCRFCLISGTYTILKENESIKVYNESICIDCASKEILNELSSLGIQISEHFIPYITRLLRLKRDYEAILKMLSNEIDPLADSKLTLYDIIEPTKEIEKITLKDLRIPDALKEILLSTGINILTDIQAKAIKAGLLDDKNLLIVSSTTSGKTLIGEIAGVTKVLKEGKRFIFLVPLVALANQKYDDFRRKYQRLGLKVAIRIGMSRIDVGEEELVVVDTEISNADIIVATYEAFDYILRSGQFKEINNIGTIVVDEIQMLSDEERGCEIAGLISRMMNIYPNAQYIFLSATVGNPDELAKILNAKLVFHESRPVPIERHVIFLKSESDKLRFLKRLINAEYSVVSSYGYPGQSIVFTHSRKRASEIAKELNSKGVRIATYHAGLSYSKRRMVEIGFERGIYKAVITTAALGAGVDFPASQVIFYDLAMGKDWLTNAEFHQFMGRAGRLGKHDKGKVFLLVVPGRKIHAGQDRTEDEVAISLLTGSIEPVSVNCNLDMQAGQILAHISMMNGISINELQKMTLLDLFLTENISNIINSLEKLNMLRKTHDNYIHLTQLGKAVAVSFFTPEMAKKVIMLLNNNEHPLDIAINITPLENVYISSKLHNALTKIFRSKVSIKLFSGHVLDLINNVNYYRKNLPKWILDLVVRWIHDFFNCNCPDSPYCDHGQLNVLKKVVELRKYGMTPSKISAFMLKKYEIHIYPGDIFNWLDSLIHSLKGISRIASATSRTDIIPMIQHEVENIETPQKISL
ncbi:MAG: DUF5814 domain-containing protein [Candidatus Asgardarchaeum sp.]